MNKHQEHPRNPLSGREILHEFGIPFGAEYYNKNNQPRAPQWAYNHELLENVPEEGKKVILGELERIAYSISGNYWDYGQVGISQSRLNKGLAKDFVYTVKKFYEMLGYWGGFNGMEILEEFGILWYDDHPKSSEEAAKSHILQRIPGEEKTEIIQWLEQEASGIRKLMSKDPKEKFWDALGKLRSQFYEKVFAYRK